MFDNPCCVLNLSSSLLLQAPSAEKLPVLYLVDSIVKNVGGEYLAVFAKNLITSFICVFEKVQLSLLPFTHSALNTLSVLLLASLWLPALTPLGCRGGGGPWDAYTFITPLNELLRLSVSVLWVVAVDQVPSSVAGGREHQEEFVQAALHLGRRVPSQEAVRPGRPRQRGGPGVAHQATAGHRERQHPRQPQVPQAGVQ